jgi:hypothetical protein
LTPQQIAAQNKVQNQRAGQKLFQDDIQRLLERATDPSQEYAYAAIEKLGKAGVPITMTAQQLNDINNKANAKVSGWDYVPIPGIGGNSQTIIRERENAKNILSYLNKYGYQIQ